MTNMAKPKMDQTFEKMQIINYNLMFWIFNPYIEPSISYFSQKTRALVGILSLGKVIFFFLS